MTLLQQIADHLESCGVRYAVIGAAALAVHGISRATFDIDLMTPDARVLDERFWDALRQDAAVRVEVRAGDDTDPLQGVVRAAGEDERPVDLIVTRHRWQAEAVDRATRTRVLGADVPVVRVPDLVLLKLYAGGHQDRWDVEQLLADAPPAVHEEIGRRIDALPADSRALWEDIQRRNP